MKHMSTFFEIQSTFPEGLVANDAAVDSHTQRATQSFLKLDIDLCTTIMSLHMYTSVTLPYPIEKTLAQTFHFKIYKEPKIWRWDVSVLEEGRWVVTSCVAAFLLKKHRLYRLSNNFPLAS